MTEFSTNNEINNKLHLSQPLQNSPRHFHPPQNSPNHFANITNHFTYKSSSATTTPLSQQQQQLIHNNNKNNQQTLPQNSSAITTATITPTSSSSTSAAQSPLHYRNPYNSPSNSPFTYAYYSGGGDHRQSSAYGKGAATTAQYQQLLQHNLRGHRLPLQQHLNDLLLQQQHLQQQQQQLLRQSNKDGNNDANADTDAGELSEESLKQNVAIVLNNLDRYNNALRSIILNEQVNSSVYLDDNLLDGSDIGGCNNNFLVSNEMAMATAVTPEADFNSNATTPGSRGNLFAHDSCTLMHQQQQQQLLQQQQQQHNMVGVGVLGNGTNVGGGGNVYCSATGNALNCSLASSHDFTHDNSDYQWFLDYGYRDGCGGMQRSVLSSLSGSYNGIGDLIYYEDLAKNLDANLAEVDMESFRAEDIHSLLSHLPSYCKSLGGGNSRLQQSLFLQQQQQQQHMLPHAAQYAHNMMSQMSNTSTNELIDNSICKSELLFSPVKESHLSVDSLDMDGYPDEGDIILTCKANKDNYTIAFEGSVLYSDDSFYEPNEISMKNKQNYINLHSNLDDIVKRKSMEMSMSRSEQALATQRSKGQKSNTTQLQRYPSGNNNNNNTTDIITITRHVPSCLVRKSSSLPNLHSQQEFLMTAACNRMQQLNVSQAISTSTVESSKLRNLLPMCQMPISVCNSTSASISERLSSQRSQQHQQLQQPLQHRHKHRCCCSNSSSSAAAAAAAVAANSHINGGCMSPQQKHAHISGSASSGNSNPPAFNLVKLFIKQKSSNCSSEEQISAHTCMDVSSGCWPSSEAAGSSSSSSLEQRLRKKSMNDSGKGSALSRHDEEDLMREHNEAENECAFGNEINTEHSTPKRNLRMRNDAVFYDEDPSSSSTGSLTATNSPAHRRRSMPLRNPQLCNVMTQHNNGSSAGSLLSSEASRSNSEQVTQMYLSSGTAASGATVDRKKSRATETSRRTSTASNSEMVTRSMQTSSGSLSSRSSLSERLRCVPPSFLAKLNNLGEERQAPIYVIYPNYALPDLGFVKTNSAADVIFTPFNYKMAVGGAASDSTSSLKKRISETVNEDEVLKNIDYKHVMDWQSLATLLPADYRRRLKHIPEVGKLMHDLDSELSQRPLFCMTPPMRRNRPNICDCAKYFQLQQTQLPATGEEGGTSSSSSSQQPSSGYRGSSTLLTDSELDNADPLRQMYVYQYEQTRMDSGVEMSPVVNTRMPPQPMPRGILRKTASQSLATRTKRNSMIEDQQAKLSKLEKRRSLQEPPYRHAVGSSEELYGVFEEEHDDLYAVPQPRKEHLSRKEADARARAENFLSSLPRSELKHYAEIASILESESCENQVQYDAVALKKEVSRVLSQQKKVSFNDADGSGAGEYPSNVLADKRQSHFTTPPNSPNISMATNGSRVHSNGHMVPRRCSQAELYERRKTATAMVPDEKERRKIESNRFKRLQIQWELMSKDSSMLKDLASAQETQSGGSTPTSAAAHKSRIPRPVSYPAGKRTETPKKNTNINTNKNTCKITNPKTNTNKELISTAKSTKPTCVSPKIITRISAQEVNAKATAITMRSPSRIVPPKRYSMGTPPGSTAVTSPTIARTPPASAGAVRARTPNSRGAVTAPNTPKRSLPSPRTIPRVR